MTAETTNFLALALLGGVLGLDAVSLVQSMISRPIVAGPLAGVLLGDPQGGMMAGAVLEILSLHQLPIGASRHWDTGPAAIAAAMVMVSTSGAVGLVVAVGSGVLVGWVGSWSVHALRQFNARLVAGEGRGGRGSMTPARLTIGHLAAMGMDFVRAALLTLAAVWALRFLTGGGGEASGRAELAAALAALGFSSLALGADVRMMAGGRKVWTAFGAGAALTTILRVWLY